MNVWTRFLFGVCLSSFNFWTVLRRIKQREILLWRNRHQASRLVNKHEKETCVCLAFFCAIFLALDVLTLLLVSVTGPVMCSLLLQWRDPIVRRRANEQTTRKRPDAIWKCFVVLCFALFFNDEADCKLCSVIISRRETTASSYSTVNQTTQRYGV